ncbi:N-acetyltransferase family protein [Niabella insulamsoli]|uniref:GNAT family N-acetyltransferase n=1 Tax=Niabella insulamsoli TaxID=3144874 RepID=UPI0031FBB8C6
MKIVVATPDMADQMLKIYAPFITGSVVTFETKLPDNDVFRKRINSCLKRFPWLAAVQDGKVLGYAYAAAYRERDAYQWAVECSVYIDADAKKAGIATRLYNALFDLLKLQGIYKVYAVITTPNPESVGFHERFGFKWFATYTQVGFKSGQWCDVGWWQLLLKETGTDTPAPIRPFSALSAETIQSVLTRYTN